MQRRLLSPPLPSFQLWKESFPVFLGDLARVVNRMAHFTFPLPHHDWIRSRFRPGTPPPPPEKKEQPSRDERNRNTDTNTDADIAPRIRRRGSRRRCHRRRGMRAICTNRLALPLARRCCSQARARRTNAQRSDRNRAAKLQNLARVRGAAAVRIVAAEGRVAALVHVLAPRRILGDATAQATRAFPCHVRTGSALGAIVLAAGAGEGRRERGENVPADEEVGGGGGVGGDFAEAVGEADEAELATDAFGCCGIAGEVVGEGAVCFVWVWLVAIRIWSMRC